MFKGGVTLKDVALRAGISVATVSHVLNGTRKVRVDTRDRVFAAIQELGYAGHSIARSLRRGRTATLGLVVSDIENPFFAVLASRVQRAASLKGYQVIFGNSEENGEREREIVDALSAQRVDAIILAPVARDNVALLASRRTPVILVNRRFAGIEMPHVLNDDHVGAMLGFDHLWSLGHRSIAIVHNGMERSTTIERVNGVRAAYAQRGVAFDEARLSIDAGPSGDKGEAALVRLMARKNRPSAIFALGNWALLAAIRGLHAGLLRCPDDVSLVGYGVSSPYWMPSHSISIVEHPVEQMAQAAVQLCFDQLEHPDQVESIVMRPTFVAGQSSAPHSSPAATAAAREAKRRAA